MNYDDEFNMAISNTLKRKVGAQYAKRHGLDYKEVYEFIKTIDGEGSSHVWSLLEQRFGK